jgi:hypothetical protein
MFVMSALDLVLINKFPHFSKKIYSTIYATNSISIRSGLNAHFYCARISDLIYYRFLTIWKSSNKYTILKTKHMATQ